MAAAAGRSSANTDLYIGTLKASIGLFGTKAAPGKEAKFDTAGPNGGVLKYEQRGVVADRPEMEQPDAAVRSDPLADALVNPPMPPPEGMPTYIEDPAVSQQARDHAASLVDGEFRQVLVEEGSGVVVEADKVRRGVRLKDGSFVDCTEQVDAIVARTKLDRMEVVKVIDSTQIRRERVTGSFYIGAQDPADTPKLRLFYESLRRKRAVAVVKYTTRSRQQLGVIAPHARTGTLVLLSLIFAEDFREPPAKAKAIQKVAVSDAQVGVMDSILTALHGKVDDLDELRDDAIALREELRARALAGEMEASVVEPLPVADEEFDLEAALSASLEAVRAGRM